MNTLMLLRKFRAMNKLLLILTIALGLFGIYAIYSATWMRDTPFWTGQIRWMLICFPVFFLISFADYRWVRMGAIPIYIFSVILLILVFFIGVKVFGARSWLNLGFGNFQPSQLAIFGGVLIFAVFLNASAQMNPVLRILVCLALTAVPCVLILIQPYLGGTLVWLPVLFAMLFVAGVQVRYLVTLFLLGGMGEAVYEMALRRGMVVPRMRMARVVPYSGALAVALVIAMYIGVRILNLMH